MTMNFRVQVSSMTWYSIVRYGIMFPGVYGVVWCAALPDVTAML